MYVGMVVGRATDGSDLSKNVIKKYIKYNLNMI